MGLNCVGPLMCTLFFTKYILCNPQLVESTEMWKHRKRGPTVMLPLGFELTRGQFLIPALFKGQLSILFSNLIILWHEHGSPSGTWRSRRQLGRGAGKETPDGGASLCLSLMQTGPPKWLSDSHTQQKRSQRCEAISLHIKIYLKRDISKQRRKQAVGPKCLYTQSNRLCKSKLYRDATGRWELLNKVCAKLGIRWWSRG